jgi:hypothetical protein
MIKRELEALGWDVDVYLPSEEYMAFLRAYKNDYELKWWEVGNCLEIYDDAGDCCFCGYIEDEKDLSIIEKLLKINNE